jgi:hypothetical protein
VRETDEFRHCVRKHTRKNRPLVGEINRLVQELLHDCTKGEKLQKDRQPAYYTQKWSLTNLYKCDLRQGYRVTYTLEFEGAGLAVVLLELLSHDEYNERFGYKIS